MVVKVFGSGTERKKRLAKSNCPLCICFFGFCSVYCNEVVVLGFNYQEIVSNIPLFSNHEVSMIFDKGGIYQQFPATRYPASRDNIEFELSLRLTSNLNLEYQFNLLDWRKTCRACNFPIIIHHPNILIEHCHPQRLFDPTAIVVNKKAIASFRHTRLQTYI